LLGLQLALDELTTSWPTWQKGMIARRMRLVIQVVDVLFSKYKVVEWPFGLKWALHVSLVLEKVIERTDQQVTINYIVCLPNLM
jgi:hypothetical protein